jgi:nucleotide-binding universal stress UspA family protein
MKVLLATDGEEHSLAGERLFSRVADPKAVELAVLCVTTYEIDRDDPETSSVEGARARSAGIAAASIARLEAAGFTATSVQAEGDPGAEIVRKVESDGYDLVVVGAGRHRSLTERLLGTSSHYVLHNAPCSVLVAHGEG